MITRRVALSAYCMFLSLVKREDEEEQLKPLHSGKQALTVAFKIGAALGKGGEQRPAFLKIQLTATTVVILNKNLQSLAWERRF